MTLPLLSSTDDSQTHSLIWGFPDSSFFLESTLLLGVSEDGSVGEDCHIRAGGTCVGRRVVRPNV